jgi:peroxiredoxin
VTLTPSTMIGLGTALPSFSLPDLNGKVVSSADFAASRGVLVAFLCPHCPYVRHIRSEFARVADDLQRRGIAVVGINSNDASSVPEDGPDGMRQEVREAGYRFP